MIMISSKSVLLQANDLMDMRFLQNGGFRPAMSTGKISKAILEVVDLLTSTLENRLVSIKCYLDQEQLH